ncbi:EF_hand domain-containing protein [Hexamita inflata]|uniref:EF hand domain-containing protein n=1 Tax=Hexamita inflata TaxID=28002 RepID=A0AA86NRP5_9EUKA|nr:EF hand domain-containing protein [Hexamita inflata]
MGCVSTSTVKKSEMLHNKIAADMDKIVVDGVGIRHCQYEYVKEFFEHVDEQKEGRVDVSALIHILHDLTSKDYNQEDVARSMHLVDDDGDQKLNFSEFRQFIYCFLNAEPTDLPNVLFFAADKNESCTIDAKELISISQKLNIELSQEQITTITKEMGDEFDGSISYKGFQRIVAKFM